MAIKYLLGEDFIIRLQLTKQECRWLIDLVQKAKEHAETINRATPHQLFELRRDNMADLESKLNAAIKRELEKERNHGR